MEAGKTYTFEVSAKNEAGNSAPVTALGTTICEVVEPTNHAPTPTFISLTIDEDITYNGTLTATDPESDALSFTKVANPSHGTVTVDANGNFTYIPTADYNGDDSFSYSVSDANNAPVVQTVSITITDVAEPDTTPPVITLTGDASMTLTVGDSYTELGATAHDDRDGAVDVVIFGSVDTTTADTYTITYKAVDSAGNSSEVSREVVVEASTLPTITIGAVFDSDDSIDITYTNIRAGVTFSISGHADFSISDSGVISYAGEVSSTATVNLTVTVQNIGEVAVSKTFAVSILNND